MNPFSIYHTHQPEFTQGQQSIVEQMVTIAQPHAIYLLGASRLSRRSESIFMQQAPASSYISHCFYLLLMPANTGKTMDQWQDQLEHAIDALPFTVLPIPADTFKDWLHQGHPFACNLHRQAPPLYKSPGFILEEIVPPPLPTQANEKEHAHAIRLAKEFVAGAELYIIRKEYRLASFMLHQAAEQSLHSLIQQRMGYAANIHSIERLLRYASLVSYELPDVFNAALPSDQKLLDLLQKSYVAARYRPDFTIKEYELERLLQKVKRILQIGERYL